MPPRYTDHPLQWTRWIAIVWPTLAARRPILVPETLPPLESSGFERLTFAEQVGQSEDWARSLADGSRLHVQVYASGRYAHRDTFDPGVSAPRAVAHFFVDSGVGKSLLLLAGSGAILAGVGAAIDWYRSGARTKEQNP